MKAKGISRPPSRGGCWPTRQQELLLQAALLQGNRSLNAWHLWKNTTDIEIDKLDFSSFRLLPQVYRNLCNQGLNDDPLIEKLKGIYRLHWYKNQRLFHHMASLLGSFHAVGIKTMILKGAALSLQYYRDYGLCGMGDFDVLVPTRKVLEAITLLKDLGWTTRGIALADLTEDYRFVRHSQPFKDSSDCELDLHWHLLPGCPSTDADDDFWEGATEIKINNVSTYALNHTDQLLHVCIHGAVWNDTPHLRWVVDAMAILKVVESEIDWSRFLMQAQKRRLTMPLKETLLYLREKFDAPVSPEVLKALQNKPVSKREYLEYRFTTTPPTFLSVLIKLWLINLRLTEGVGFWKRLVLFSRYLPYWRMPPLWKLPLHAGVRGMKKLLRNITRQRRAYGKSVGH